MFVSTYLQGEIVKISSEMHRNGNFHSVQLVTSNNFFSFFHLIFFFLSVLWCFAKMVHHFLLSCIIANNSTAFNNNTHIFPLLFLFFFLSLLCFAHFFSFTLNKSNTITQNFRSTEKNGLFGSFRADNFHR